jgi:hypothetical protein
VRGGYFVDGEFQPVSASDVRNPPTGQLRRTLFHASRETPMSFPPSHRPQGDELNAKEVG